MNTDKVFRLWSQETIVKFRQLNLMTYVSSPFINVKSKGCIISQSFINDLQMMYLL